MLRRETVLKHKANERILKNESTKCLPGPLTWFLPAHQFKKQLNLGGKYQQDYPDDQID